jgi:hypothetical protein
MYNVHKLQHQSKKQIMRFAKLFTQPLSVAKQRMTLEIMYGGVSSNSGLLSEIARSLNEPISINATEKRLARNLAAEPMYQTIEEDYMSFLEDEVTPTSAIVIDGTDIVKPRAKKMEALAHIHDGSEDKTAPGYWLLKAAIVRKNREEVIPITTRLYSTLEENFKSANDELDTLLETLMDHFENTAPFVFDSGICSQERLKMLKNNTIEFVTRLNAPKANIIYQGESKDYKIWANERTLSYSIILKTIRNGKQKKQKAWYGVFPVLYGGQEYNAIVMQIEGHKPCVLLSNIPIRNMKYANYGKKIISIYGMRWSVEELIRLEKQVFDIENVRVRSLIALKNYVMIMNLASAFLTYFGFINRRTSTMVRYVREHARSFKPPFRFVQYQIAMGLKSLFSKTRKRVFHFKRKHIAEPELQLVFSNRFG